MECPKCSLVNPEGAEACDCGYEFLTGAFRAKNPAGPSNGGGSQNESGGIGSFGGRIGRGEFWTINLCLGVAEWLAGAAIGIFARSGPGAAVVSLLLLITVVVVSFWLALALQVRRWHDLNKSGWMVALNLTLIFIPVAFVMLGFIRGTNGANRFGADPLQARITGSKYAPRNKSTCDRCGVSFPSAYYLERATDGSYLCEKCRSAASAAGD